MYDKVIQLNYYRYQTLFALLYYYWSDCSCSYEVWAGLYANEVILHPHNEIESSS